MLIPIKQTPKNLKIKKNQSLNPDSDLDFKTMMNLMIQSY
jgi:hypothetical protein